MRAPSLKSRKNNATPDTSSITTGKVSKHIRPINSFFGPLSWRAATFNPNRTAPAIASNSNPPDTQSHPPWNSSTTFSRTRPMLIWICNEGCAVQSSSNVRLEPMNG
ncbi:hypothetical protein D9M72_602130 [compost metagenome]